MPLLSTPPLALYVHFPWCVRKCPYCDFNSYTLHGELPQAAYLECLARDLEAQAVAVGARPVVSVFLGGGTPSLFAPEAVARVLAAARAHLALEPDAEVTLEANPGTIERGAFGEYRAAGVTRVSLGAQSFDAQKLARLGRIHSPAETRRAAEELHAAGLHNFNLDLMYGLPEQDEAGGLRDLEEALALSPAHLSHYHLTLEPGTVFAALPPALPDDETTDAVLAACAARLAQRGFAQYEVSAWAQPGRECRHNLNYWSFGDYLGIGAGAHGKLTSPAAGEIVRTVQAREPRRYLAAGPAGLARRAVAPAELPFEFMLNALRLTRGFQLDWFGARTGLATAAIQAPLDLLVRRGLLVEAAGGYRPSELGLRFLNELLLEFMPETPKMSGALGMSIASGGAPRPLPGSLFTARGGVAGE